VHISRLADHTPSAEGTAPPADDPASHKNEGFLKSMWHILTSHPGHAKANGPAAGGSPGSKESGTSSPEPDAKDPKKKTDDSQEK
jgi:molecular chaperone DnaJ